MGSPPRNRRRPPTAMNTPRTNEEFNFPRALSVAQSRVKQSNLWRKFIDGTPLANDIAVWIAQAYMEGAESARRLETELIAALERVKKLESDKAILEATIRKHVTDQP